MKMTNRNYEREYDRIASSRMRTTNGGFPLHISLGQPESIRFRWRLKRMGVECEEMVQLIDEIAYQKSLLNQPMGVRFATVKRKQKKSKIWGSKLD